jgi:hypothetical protein
MEQVTAAFEGRMKPGLKDCAAHRTAQARRTESAALTRMPPAVVGLTQICVRTKSPLGGV